MENSRRRQRGSVAFCALATALASWPASAVAQATTTGEELPEIVVTAEKIRQRAQDVPASLTVLPRQTLEDSGIVSVQEVARLTPNLLMSDQGSSRFSINTIRGIGTTVRDDYFNGALGVYLDGVPLTNAEFNRRLGDIERVEILRGPQGTLYGHNTPAGVISLTSRAPGVTLEMEARGLIGDRGQREATASIGGPLGGALSGRMFVDYAERDGYTNYARPNRGIDHLEAFNLSGALNYRPDENLKITLSGALENNDQGSYAYQPFATFRARRLDIQPPNEEIRRSRSLAATIAYDMGGSELTAISGYRRYDVDSKQDLSYNVFVTQFGGGRSNSTERGEQFSQELRLAGKSGALRWLLGGFFQTDNVDYDYIFSIPAFGSPSLSASRYKRRDLAAFGEVTWTAAPRLDLTAGLRVARETHEVANNVPFDARSNFTLVTPKLRLAYRFDDDRQVYVSATRGARSGGFDRLSSQPAYGSEYLWSYEAGVKSEWLYRTLSFNAALFRIDWTDQQVKSMPMPGQIRTTNAGRSVSQGFEADLNWRVTPQFDLGAFIGVTRSRYERYVNPPGIDLTGNRLANTPAMNAGVVGQYRAPLAAGTTVVARAEYLYVGDHYFDPENRLEQPGYGIVNLRVGLELKHLDVVLFAKNLFDRDYRAFGYTDFQGSRFATDVALAGQPRLIGVAVTARY